MHKDAAHVKLMPLAYLKSLKADNQLTDVSYGHLAEETYGILQFYEVPQHLEDQSSC